MNDRRSFREWLADSWLPLTMYAYMASVVLIIVAGIV